MYRRLLFGRLWRPVARTASFGVLIALFLVCGALYAETTTVKLSPLVARSTLLGPVDGSREIGVTLALPLSDPEGVAEFVRHVSTAGDPLFRHYLTPQQFAQRFGGNAADYAYLKSWAAANGLRVTHESLGRINLTVRGSVTQFQRLFNTQLSTYRAPDGQEFYSANVEPVVPSEIASRISGVIGLTESKMVTPMVKVAKCLGEDPAPASNLLSPDTAGGTGPGGSYSAANLRSVYNIPTFGHLNPNAVAAVFEQGGYDSSDVTKYLTYNRLPKVTVTPVSVDSSPTSVQDDAGVELEAVLDIDVIAGINPAISAIRVYIDSYNWDPFQTALLDAITQVGDDDIAQVFSISYGQDEGYQGQLPLRQKTPPWLNWLRKASRSRLARETAAPTATDITIRTMYRIRRRNPTLPVLAAQPYAPGHTRFMKSKKPGMTWPWDMAPRGAVSVRTGQCPTSKIRLSMARVT